jgi:hypothetical protein
MFIKPTKKKVGDKTYVNHVLVESVATPNGPRHRTVCSLGSLAPAPAEEWLAGSNAFDVTSFHHDGTIHDQGGFG